jgi:hypothetical protein
VATPESSTSSETNENKVAANFVGWEVFTEDPPGVSANNCGAKWILRGEKPRWKRSLG